MTTPRWIIPDQLFDGTDLRSGMAIKVAEGRIVQQCTRAAVPKDIQAQSLKGIVSPGFIDLQVNGGGGVLLNQMPTPAGLASIGAAHRRFGTVAILPTLITDAPDVLARAAQAVIAARGQVGIIGLHIEGPHISVVRRGTHAECFIRPLDDTTIAVVRALRAADVPVMITLAPEAVVPGQIAALAAMGAVVSIGHSDATAAGTRAALAEGASCFTHLFNAMSPMLNRSAGVVGAAINSAAYAGIICDGIHVADEMIGLAVRARPLPDRMVLVSDAMPTVGGPDHFTLYGQDIWLRDGRLVNHEGSLAGAHVTMAESVQRIVTVVGVGLQVALRMAVTVPAEVIGRPDLARLAGRALTDVVLLDADLVTTPLQDALAGATAIA